MVVHVAGSFFFASQTTYAQSNISPKSVEQKCCSQQPQSSDSRHAVGRDLQCHQGIQGEAVLLDLLVDQ